MMPTKYEKYMRMFLFGAILNQVVLNPDAFPKIMSALDEVLRREIQKANFPIENWENEGGSYV